MKNDDNHQVTLSVVIPVYNEEKFISQTIEQVVFADCYGMKKEIILVDDGSKDDTVGSIKRYIKKHQNNNIEIKTCFKQKNQGKGAALKDGFLMSTGEIVIVQDADLEYSPSDYLTLIEPFIKNSADVVYGSRFISDRPHRVMYFWHSQVNRILTLFSNIFTNLNLTDMETGFKVFRGDLIRGIAPKLRSQRFGFEPEITARIAKINDIKIYEVGISYSGRTYTEGKKIGWKDGVVALIEIVRYSLFD